MNKYKAQSNQGFFEETGDNDEIDDYTFLTHPKQGSEGYLFGSNDEAKNRTAENRQQQLMDELETIQRRTLDSSKRSLGLVHESEQIGVATAEDLLKQRDQLENCEKRVTDINSTLRVSQKHLTSIQSVFAGFKSIFSKSSAETPTPNAGKSNPTEEKPSTKPASNSTLGDVLESSKSQSHYKPAVHPGLKIRGIYEEDDDDDGYDNRNAYSSSSQRSTTSKVEEQLDQNLVDLTSGLSRLKGLAMGLGNEIDEQNELIDKVMRGSEKADLGIERQNKQMKKILNK